MKTLKFFATVLVVLVSFSFASCSDDGDVFEYTNEQKGQMAFLSYTSEDWVKSDGLNDYLLHLYVFAVVHGDRLTGDYYYVNNGETEEIRMKMLYGEELVFFPGDSEKSVWNAKVEFSTKISERQPLPAEYAVELTGSTTAGILVKNIYGVEIHLGIGFDSFDADQMDRGTFGDI